MKNLTRIILILTIGLASCQKKGCTDPQATNYDINAEKHDQSCTYIPTIVLTGSDTIDIPLGVSFVDPGVSAFNSDGSQVEVTTLTYLVNTNTVGTYYVLYKAENDYGVATANRTVNVVITRENWLGFPTATQACDFSPFNFDENAGFFEGNTASDIIIAQMFTDTGGFFANINAIIDGSTITIPSQQFNGPNAAMTVSGLGTMNANATQSIVNYDYTITANNIPTSGSCTITYNY